MNNERSSTQLKLYKSIYHLQARATFQREISRCGSIESKLSILIVSLSSLIIIFVFDKQWFPLPRRLTSNFHIFSRNLQPLYFLIFIFDVQLYRKKNNFLQKNIRLLVILLLRIKVSVSIHGVYQCSYLCNWQKSVGI